MTPCAIRNNKKTQTAESTPTYVGTFNITDVNIVEMHLSVVCDGSFVYVICWFYWFLCFNNIFCLVYVSRYFWDPTSNVYIYVRFLCFLCVSLYYIFFTYTLIRNLLYTGRNCGYVLYEEFVHCAINNCSKTLLSKHVNCNAVFL